MNVVKPFMDKFTKRPYYPGDEYLGSEERIADLVKKGLIVDLGAAIEKQVIQQTKPEKVNVLFSKYKGKKRGNKPGN